MRKVKDQGPTVGPTTHRFKYRPFHINARTHSRDTAISKSWPGKPMVAVVGDGKEYDQLNFCIYIEILVWFYIRRGPEHGVPSHKVKIYRPKLESWSFNKLNTQHTRCWEMRCIYIYIYIYIYIGSVYCNLRYRADKILSPRLTGRRMDGLSKYCRNWPEMYS